MEVFVRRLIPTAIAVFAAGLSIPVSASAAHAVVPTRAVAAACSITTPSGGCYSAGEFCSKAEFGQSTTAADGEAIKCVQDGQFLRWLGSSSTTAAGSGTTASTATGQSSTSTSGTTATVPLGGIAAGGGGLALAASRQAAPTQDSSLGLPTGLAAGALAAGLGSVLVVRKRRAANRR
ncbi:hypothetical protein ABUW04_12025 [Streptacidiphilus sp. N1-10]|uniref:Gram-positive cocci surface proteins LPxTG domain-containing protein n=1 Tax=Streptacidiphilus jeojiensis TaxID=3229225 RepID=A0ABV6XL52_9ACTN